MQMQAIKQNSGKIKQMQATCKGKQKQTRKMVRETMQGRQKQMHARKTMQMPKKIEVGT